MGRLSGLISVILGLAAVAAAVLWLRREPAPEPEGPGRPPFVLPTTTAPVQRGDLVPEVELTGSVRAPLSAELGFQRAGRLVELLVRDGDRVEAGTVVARLSAVVEQLALEEAEANLTLVRAEFERVQAGERPEVIARLEAERDEREAELALARLEVDRGAQLVEEEFLPRSDQDRREAESKGAAARAAAAGASLALAQAGTRSEDIVVAAARLRVAEATLARRKAELERMELVMPRDGIVVRRLAAPGDYLTPGDSVLSTVDAGELEVELEVPASYAERLGVEPRVQLQSDDIVGLNWEGPLTTVVPVADPITRNFRALVRLPAGEASSQGLRPGQFLRARITLEPARDALLVPKDAVRQGSSGSEVVVVVPGPEGPDGRPSATARVQGVRILARSGERVAVVPLGGEPGTSQESASPAGLAEGDRLVVRGLGLAFPGAALLVRDDLTAGNPGGQDSAEEGQR